MSKNSEIHLLRISPSSAKYTLDDLANKILKINLEKLTKNAAKRKPLDPEEIHDMRVAIRRIRAAIKTFKKILPKKAKTIQAELQKLSRILGKKRDLDIFSEFIHHTINTELVSFSKLTRQIDKARKRIFSILKSKFYANLIAVIEKLKTKPAKQNIFNVARKRIRKALTRVLKIAPRIDSKADDKTLHKLRISIKKLRYTCEFFEPIFSLSAFIEKTKKIQDILGEHQDAITGISMLNHYKNQFSSEEVLRIKNKFEQKKKEMRKLFFKIWKDYLNIIQIKNI